jgi:hypothetical protein
VSLPLQRRPNGIAFTNVRRQSALVGFALGQSAAETVSALADGTAVDPEPRSWKVLA